MTIICFHWFGHFSTISFYYPFPFCPMSHIKGPRGPRYMHAVIKRRPVSASDRPSVSQSIKQLISVADNYTSLDCTRISMGDRTRRVVYWLPWNRIFIQQRTKFDFGISVVFVRGSSDGEVSVISLGRVSCSCCFYSSLPSSSDIKSRFLLQGTNKLTVALAFHLIG